jgi:multiple sugar transport system permease protein/sn-glycerol 3-phosphate transport system permease protein
MQLIRGMSTRQRETAAGYLFVAPTMIGFLVFILVPTFAIFIIALYKWDLVGIPIYLGWTNYGKLFSDPLFANSLKVTAIYVLYNLPVQFLLAIVLALVLQRIGRGQKFFRTLVLLPWITTPVAISIVWKWILNQRLGLLNYYLGLTGVTPIDWFNVSHALGTIAAVNIWEYVGFSTILFLVGLQSIPNDYHEAAKMDGFNARQEFFFITLPLLKPTILYQTVTGLISSFQVFDTIYGMTRGGPGNATNVLYYSIYLNGFQFLNMGYAAAECVVLFLVLLVITAIQLAAFRDR